MRPYTTLHAGNDRKREYLDARFHSSAAKVTLGKVVVGKRYKRYTDYR